MKKVSAVIFTAAAVAIALSGCAGPSQTHIDSGATSAPVNPDPRLTADPASSAKDRLLAATREIPGLSNTTSLQAIEAASYVCGKLQHGTNPTDITVVLGADQATNRAMVTASTIMCEQHAAAVQQAFSQ